MINKLGYYLRRPGNYLFILYHDISFGIFSSILVLKSLLFTYIVGYEITSFFPSFGVILAFLSFSILIKNKVFKLFYLFTVNLLCSLLFLTHSLYFNYFSDFASIYYLKQINQLSTVGDVIITMMNKEVFFILDLIILPFLLFRFKKLSNYNIPEKFKVWFFLLTLSLLFNIHPIIYIYNMRSANNFFESIYDRNDFVRDMGIIKYQIVDIYYFLLTERQKSQITSSNINSVIDWKIQNRVISNNDLTGIGKGLNLIMIQVESLQNFVIGISVNNREITPNLNKLVREGIYFKNIYDQSAAGNSSDAMLLVNSSLYPSRKGAASFLYSQDFFDSLPKVLGEHGYTTAVMEAYKRQFWNYERFDKALGFNYQFYEDDFIMTEKIGGFLKGLSDRAFLLQSIQKISKLPQPFYVILRTLSTHAPFAHITTDIDNFPLSDLEGEIIGYYIRSMHYVDSAIGTFLHKLHENNLTSNTMIVIYGDHRARLPMSELKRIGIYDSNENKKIPLIIYLPNKNQRCENDTIGGLIDVAPTVCNILGVDILDKFFLGRDLVNSHYSFVIFRDSSYIYRDNSIDKTYAQNQLRISDLILEKDMVTLIKNRGIHY